MTFHTNLSFQYACTYLICLNSSLVLFGLISSVALLPIHVIIRVKLSLFTDNNGKYSQDKFAKSDNLAIYI